MKKATTNLTPERLEAEVTAILRTLDIVAIGLRDILKQGRAKIARRPARLAADLRLVSSALTQAEIRAAMLGYDANPAPRPDPEHASGLTHADLDALTAVLDGVEARNRATKLGEGEDGAWLRRQLDSLNPTP